ncbi:hypothetical protein M409DRAFT_71569 [Zasmidium cellare ATCC 36951]|uniref:Amino acid transporter transmembrane domain-containing protein n=1 Tax=Zasmidium cellare ATCC 36951 TaxID=1080233 RepID=A0A6A6BV25_ZASCE|nr:uncharacterized protein M409DRAFT_71569 [Zasmidium cellare ATCC 36951]KAF2158591.1 hypothetical protein M409DRAFT_71569 [Zasmidium cellare ATCC 36951]
MMDSTNNIDEKRSAKPVVELQQSEPSPPSIRNGTVVDKDEVFKASADGVDFRTVTWQRPIIILLKVQVATGVLGIPSAMGTLGAVPGSLVVVGWQALNTYTTCILIDFRNRRPYCHTIVDMYGVMWGLVGRELVGIMFVVAFVLCTGSGLLGTSIAFNALFAAIILVIMFSSIRTWDRMTWPMTLGVASVLGGVLAVVVGVALRDRPAAAPAEGAFELGFDVVGAPTFAAGITATATISISSSAGPVYLPIIAEMRRPQDYRKAVIPVGFMVGAIYLTVSLVVYHYCGQWIATPSLGSAGPLIKKVAYGIPLPSLVVSTGIFNHAAAKYAFVRVLRGSPHSQQNTWQHLACWIGLNVVFGALAFVFASAIPVFSYMLSLAGSVCFAPMSLIFPALMWFYDFGGHGWNGTVRSKAMWLFHALIVLVGAFLTVGGVYGTAESIRKTYDGSSGVGAFNCADNSGTIV